MVDKGLIFRWLRSVSVKNVRRGSLEQIRKENRASIEISPVCLVLISDTFNNVLLYGVGFSLAYFSFH